MQKNLTVCFLAGSLVVPVLATAEEGMWPPAQIPRVAQNLVSFGLEIDPSELSNPGSPSMSAVVQLGGCSASFVSPEGLIITNYHCAYSSLQLNSSVERNLLAEGFFARSREEELPSSPGLHAYVTVDIADVTSQILGGIDGTREGGRSAQVDARRDALKEKCENEPGHRCRVASFFGNQYLLIRQLEIRDLRLVYAPPAGIGRYGGDEDNFTWPQQRGDFAFFRAYVAPDGRPSDPAPENRCFHPTHSLKIAREPLADGDFVMVVGYPGSTNRYRFSSEAEHSFLWHYPRLVESYEKWLLELRKAVRNRPDAALKYAGFDAGLNNTLKYARGMVESFSGSGILERKLSLEKELADWIEVDPGRKAVYGNTLTALREAFAGQRETRELDLRYHLATRSSLLSAARQLHHFAREGGGRAKEREKLRQSLEKLIRNFDPRVDRAIWKAFLTEYNRLPAKQRRTDLDDWFHLSPGRNSERYMDRILDRMYARTRLGDRNALLALANATSEEIEASRDPFLRLAAHLDALDRIQERREEERSNNLRDLYTRYMAALVAFRESRGETLYPDANGTLRIAFGRVEGYTTAAGTLHRPFTTAEDIVARHTGAEPFDTPASSLRALREQRFGRYRDPALGSLPVNFLGTVDVTGGNSGAPTLNQRGELVGLLFDINQEGIISSWNYVPARTRSVHLDIRYVLWLLTEVDHADTLLAELALPWGLPASSDEKMAEAR